MTSIPLAQAKNQLSELIGRVERGESVTVTRRGKPVARLEACGSEAPEQQDRRVRDAFEQLSVLRQGLELEGDLKSIAREGLA